MNWTRNKSRALPLTPFVLSAPTRRGRPVEEGPPGDLVIRVTWETRAAGFAGPNARKWPGRAGVGRRIVPVKPGNSGGGKTPDFWHALEEDKDQGIGDEPRTMMAWPKPCAGILERGGFKRVISASPPPVLPLSQRPPSEQHRSAGHRQIGLDRMIGLLNEEQPVEANAGASQLGDRAPEWNDVPSVVLGKKTFTRICGDEETPALALHRGIEYHFYPPAAVPIGMVLP